MTARPASLARSTIVIVALAAGLLRVGAQEPEAGVPAPGGPATAEDADKSARASGRARALETIRGEIARLEKRLAGLEGRSATLERRLERTETQLALQEERLAEATAERTWAEERLAESGHRVEKLEASLVAVRDDLARRLGGMYRLGRGGYLRLAMSLDRDVPALPALRQIRFLASRDGDALAAFEEARKRLALERVNLEREREAATAWQATEAERRQALAATRTEQARLLARIERERRTVKARTQVLETKAQKLATLIGALLDASRQPLDGRPMSGFRGVLDWPVAGEVTVPFGPRRDPRYKTEVPHNGVELSTADGALVRTVYPGKVLFAAPFEGFGDTVVVHHPGQVYSLYAGLGTMRVGKDDVLRSEAVIGTASTSLYFEIRRQNKPENPLAWLR